MKFIVTIFILFVVACSSTPNPVTHSPKVKSDTVIVFDTVFHNDTAINSETIIDSVFSIHTLLMLDTLLKFDTVFQDNKILQEATQILKCELFRQFFRKFLFFEF